MCGFHERDVGVIGFGDAGAEVLRRLPAALDRTAWPYAWKELVRLGDGPPDDEEFDEAWPGQLTVVVADDDTLAEANARIAQLAPLYFNHTAVAFVLLIVGEPGNRDLLGPPGQLRLDLEGAVRVARALTEWAAFRPSDGRGGNDVDFFALGEAVKKPLRVALGEGPPPAGAFAHEEGSPADDFDTIRATMPDALGLALAPVTATPREPPVRIWPA